MDYGPNGREIRNETTVAEQRAHNIHVRDGVTEDQFVKMREARDATLGMPKLIIPALQINMKAGALPAADDQGTSLPEGAAEWPLNAALPQRETGFAAGPRL